MADLSTPDDIRIEKLRRWLEGKGIDVVQIGNELCCPSPFKEREKRKTDPHYHDDKRRLSITVVQEAGIPTLRWQCWWSKGKTGKPFGGRSAYAVSILAKTSQEEIAKLLDLEYDAQVEAAETNLDKAIAILGQPARQLEARRQFAAAKQAKVRRPHQLPTSLLRMWDGSPLTMGGEQMVTERGILPEIGKTYGLLWDYEEQAVVMPWADRDQRVMTYQCWYGSKYRFPKESEDLMTKMDAIFGLHTWTPGRPLILCEGGFTAMSVCGMALGGSTISDEQIALIHGCAPSMTVVAFDNDTGGLYGAQGVTKALSQAMPYTRVVPVFAPTGNDWNDVIKVNGFQKTMELFARRIKDSLTMEPAHAIALQYRGTR
jgi:hypothetical protein